LTSNSIVSGWFYSTGLQARSSYNASEYDLSRSVGMPIQSVVRLGNLLHERELGFCLRLLITLELPNIRGLKYVLC